MTFTFLNLTRGGWVAIHKAGCKDIAKAVRRGDVNNQWDEQHPTVQDAISEFIAGNDFDNVSESDFTVYPCCKETK